MTTYLIPLIIIGGLTSAGVYLLLERHLTRMLLGLLLISNAVNLQKTAAELRGEGLKRVTAAGYLDEKQTVDLSLHQMVGCSFESLFKLSGQSFGLVTADEVSALALKIGGGTMPHFECVFVLRDLLNELGTRFLVLDAAAGFKMSDTEPSTVTQDFFKLVAPHRKVVSVALDPANMPMHLKRQLRVSYGGEKGQAKGFWLQLEDSVAAWQADKSLLALSSTWRTVCSTASTAT